MIIKIKASIVIYSIINAQTIIGSQTPLTDRSTSACSNISTSSEFQPGTSPGSTGSDRGTLYTSQQSFEEPNHTRLPFEKPKVPNSTQKPSPLLQKQDRTLYLAAKVRANEKARRDAILCAMSTSAQPHSSSSGEKRPTLSAADQKEILARASFAQQQRTGATITYAGDQFYTSTSVHQVQRSRTPTREELKAKHNAMLEEYTALAKLKGLYSDIQKNAFIERLATLRGDAAQLMFDKEIEMLNTIADITPTPSAQAAAACSTPTRQSPTHPGDLVMQAGDWDEITSKEADDVRAATSAQRAATPPLLKSAQGAIAALFDLFARATGT